MEMYVWLMVVVSVKEEWRYVSMMCGEQYVMISGIRMMLKWFVINLVTQLMVRLATRQGIFLPFECTCTFITAAVAIKQAFFGEGVDPIYLDNVACVGDESELTACVHNGVGVHNCVHSQDAGVKCRA